MERLIKRGILILRVKESLEKRLGKIPGAVVIDQPQVALAWQLEAKRLDSEFTAYSSPLKVATRLSKSPQSEAAVLAYERLLDDLREIEQGRIPLHLDVNGYFSYFRELMDHGTETARLVARLLPIRAIEKIKKLRFFSRFEKAIRDKTLDIEYVVCIPNPASLKEADVVEGLRFYLEITPRVFILYEKEYASLSLHELSQTILLLQRREWVFRHGWDNDGNLVNPVQYVLPRHYKHYMGIWEKARNQSVSCPAEIRGATTGKTTATP